LPAKLHAIISALKKAKSNATSGSSKPTFVHIRTIIGFGSQKANSGPVHGAALGEADVEHVKSSFGFDPKKKFQIYEEVYGMSLLYLLLTSY
jgi:dihydroxyacetone synthase